MHPLFQQARTSPLYICGDSHILATLLSYKKQKHASKKQLGAAVFRMFPLKNLKPEVLRIQRGTVNCVLQENLFEVIVV